MADAHDIQAVRLNTDTLNESPWGDEYVSGLIDTLGVDGASATIWRVKAASFSKEVDVTEAGATHKFSALFTNASAMATKYEALAAAGGTDPSVSRPKVNTIVRS